MFRRLLAGALLLALTACAQGTHTPAGSVAVADFGSDVQPAARDRHQKRGAVRYGATALRRLRPLPIPGQTGVPIRPLAMSPASRQQRLSRARLVNVSMPMADIPAGRHSAVRSPMVARSMAIRLSAMWDLFFEHCLRI